LLQSRQRVIYSTDGFIEKEEEDLIGLERAQIYIEANKQAIEAQNAIISYLDITLLEEK